MPCRGARKSMCEKRCLSPLLLEVKNLNVSFIDGKREFPILRDITFSLAKGENLGFVGESGCGKSMTAYSLLRLLPEGMKIVSGNIIYKGKDITKFTEKELTGFRGREIAMVFQNPSMALNPVLTVGEQIIETMLNHGISRREAFKKAVSLLDELKIAEPEKIVKEYPHMLSGGMCQRVVIAIALACEPEILIADEPTTALDVIVQKEVLDIIKNICTKRGMGLVIVSHDLGVISYMADSVGVMYCGKLIEQGAIKDILNNPAHPYTKGLLAALPKHGKELLCIKGIVPKFSDWTNRGCMFFDRCEYHDDKCKDDFGYVVIEQAHRALCRKVNEI